MRVVRHERQTGGGVAPRHRPLVRTRPVVAVEPVLEEWQLADPLAILLGELRRRCMTAAPLRRAARGERGGRRRVGNGRRRIERLRAPQVLGKQRPSRSRPEHGVEHRRVCLQRDGVVEVVEPERKPEGDRLGDRHRVERGPRRKARDLQRLVLGRQRRARRDECVDARRVRLERLARFLRDHGHRAFGRAPDADRAQLDVARERGGTEQLGQRSARTPAADVHLEQPVLRMHPALHEVQVVVVARADVRDAVDVACDLGGGVQSRQRRRPSGLAEGRRVNGSQRAQRQCKQGSAFHGLSPRRSCWACDPL